MGRPCNGHHTREKLPQTPLFQIKHRQHLQQFHWEREFRLPWREAGPPNHHDDKADSDQKVVKNGISLFIVFIFASVPGSSHPSDLEPFKTFGGLKSSSQLTRTTLFAGETVTHPRYAHQNTLVQDLRPAKAPVDESRPDTTPVETIRELWMRGDTRAEDARLSPTQSHVSPSIQLRIPRQNAPVDDSRVTS